MVTIRNGATMIVQDGKNAFWKLKSIIRKKKDLHTIIFDVDGKSSVELTIKGSFSLKSGSAEGVIPSA